MTPARGGPRHWPLLAATLSGASFDADDLAPRDVARFEASARIGEPAVCWPWDGPHAPNGAPRFVTGTGSNLNARRVALALAGVRLDADRMPVPTCGTTGCVNPWHLAQLTRADVARRVAGHRADFDAWEAEL